MTAVAFPPLAPECPGAALGLEVQCVAQADADGAEDGGLACDGRDERGHDGYGEGNADKSAGETAAHAAHASQTDALAEACFLDLWRGDNPPMTIRGTSESHGEYTTCCLTPHRTM